MIWAGCIIGAYLIGAIPFGLIIGRTRGIDIRTKRQRRPVATFLIAAVSCVLFMHDDMRDTQLFCQFSRLLLLSGSTES